MCLRTCACGHLLTEIYRHEQYREILLVITATENGWGCSYCGVLSCGVAARFSGLTRVLKCIWVCPSGSVGV